MTDLAAQVSAVVEDSADMSTEQLAEQLFAMLGGEVEATLTAQIGPGWRLVGRAAKLHAEAYALLREADSLAQLAELKPAVGKVEQARQEAENEAETLAEAERVALGAVRHAEDQHRGAVEHHRECQDAAENAALVGDTPQVQTELLVFADKAQQVTERFAAALALAEQQHAQATARATAARELVKALKVAEQTARDAVTDAEQHPERAKRSAFTLSLGMTQASGEYATLTDDERANLRALVGNQAAAIGADRAARAESRKAGYDAGLADGRNEARMNLATMPQRGMQQVLPPGVGRRR